MTFTDLDRQNMLPKANARQKNSYWIKILRIVVISSTLNVRHFNKISNRMYIDVLKNLMKIIFK